MAFFCRSRLFLLFPSYHYDLFLFFMSGMVRVNLGRTNFVVVKLTGKENMELLCLFCDLNFQFFSLILNIFYA